jgi:T5orf172 domain
MSFVYFLSHNSEPRFKIGKAKNVIARARALEISRFALRTSFALEMPTEEAAYNLERILHRTFAKWRIPTSLIARSDPASDGHSEWFLSCSLALIQDFLTRNQGLLGFHYVAPESLIQRLNSSQAQSPLDPEYLFDLEVESAADFELHPDP